GAERIEYQHAVIGSYRTPGLADDHRVRNVARIAHVSDPVDDIARILVERVVHRGREVGPAAVIVDTQTTADIDVLQPGAHQLQLRIDVGQLVDGVLYAADVLQLAARMAMNELQTIEHVV